MSQHPIDTDGRSSASHENPQGAGVRTGDRSGDGDVRHHRNHAGSSTHVAREARLGSTYEPSQDTTLEALDTLKAALEELARDQRLLEDRLKDLSRARAEGRPWREILSEEDPPGTMQIVSRMLACLAQASGTLRKELVNSLRREGVSIPAIAKLFGVTHQRVSNLLRRPPE